MAVLDSKIMYLSAFKTRYLHKQKNNCVSVLKHWLNHLEKIAFQMNCHSTWWTSQRSFPSRVSNHSSFCFVSLWRPVMLVVIVDDVDGCARREQQQLGDCGGWSKEHWRRFAVAEIEANYLKIHWLCETNPKLWLSHREQSWIVVVHLSIYWLL